MKMKSIVKLENVSKAYDRVVLDNISMEIFEGDYCAICGKSGAGKSTLMNIIGLIEGYTSGSYYFNSQLIDKKKDYSKFRSESIGFIFQSYNLIPTLNCKENIMLPALYGMMNEKQKQERFEYLVQTMGIDKLIEKKVNILSGGEKQRIAIARALLLNPKLIIADEPTGNLDPENKDIVMKALKKENENGRTILMITHDMEVAKEAKKICYLKEGKIYDTPIF